MWKGIIVYNLNWFDPEALDKSWTDYNQLFMINLLMYTPQSSHFILVIHHKHKLKIFQLCVWDLILIKLQIYLPSDTLLYGIKHQLMFREAEHHSVCTVASCDMYISESVTPPNPQPTVQCNRCCTTDWTQRYYHVTWCANGTLCENRKLYKIYSLSCLAKNSHNLYGM